MAMALEGIKIIDISQVAAVPMCARHLADFGADVIHIENPATGDSWRVFQAREDEKGIGSGAPSNINYNWETFNRNKRSVTIDLSQKAGQKIIHRMVETADIVTTNLRLWEREKFNLEYKTLNKLNPRLIYASLIGWGRQGPDKNSPAYDSLAYWARAGLGYLYAIPGMPPAVDGGAFGDNLAALALANGIVTALYFREKTGVGQEVDTSLLHAGIYQLSFFLAGTATTGMDLNDWRSKSREEYPNPLTLPYETKDDRWLLLAVLHPDRYWAALCHAIGREDLEHDPRFETFEPRIENHTALLHILEKEFKSRPLDEWKIRLKEAGIPFSPYQNFVEVIADPQVKANNMITTFKHPIYGQMEVITNPINMSKTPATLRMPAPEFGQHTEEVLLEYGYSWNDIAWFKSKDVIA